MELSEKTLQHLQDEAYALLCREALQEHLTLIERKKAEIEETRPPFALLARKETVSAFKQSMRTAIEDEAALRQRIVQLDRIDDWVRPLLRNDLDRYLAAESKSYLALLQIAARLDDWEKTFRGLPELLTALARDLRELRTVTLATGGPRTDFTQDLAPLLESVRQVEASGHELALIARAIGALKIFAGAGEVSPPSLATFPGVAWVTQLALLPVAQILAESQQAEKLVRTFLAGDQTQAAARLQAAREACTNSAENALEQYWSQLRAHARQHYVEERDVDEVLEMLRQRYVDATLKGARGSGTVDPFRFER